VRVIAALVAATISGRSAAARCRSMSSDTPTGVRRSATTLGRGRTHGAGHDKPATRPLDGGNLETERRDDARHWMSIYDDLKLGLLDRLERELPISHQAAKRAVVDVKVLQSAGRPLSNPVASHC